MGTPSSRVFARRFELLTPLGEGAMGQVWRARDLAVGREVALKLIQNASWLRLERFRREAELAARLDHPGIVRVHDAGEEGARPWIAFELVEGARTAREAMSTLPLAARVALVRDAAAALGHAHARGVVHRDVKAENVLVDAAGRVRVTDFGIATAADLERLTRTGAFLGTPLSMAPEQVEGGPIGPPTDVWGLGVLLYEALAGRLPFDGGTLADLTDQILAAAPPPPSRSRSDVPPAVEAVCLRALSRDPAARFSDGATMAVALEAEPAAAADAPGRRRVVVFGAALAVATSSAVLTSVVRTEPTPASEQRPTPSDVGSAPVPATAQRTTLRPGATRSVRLERLMAVGLPERLDVTDLRFASQVVFDLLERVDAVDDEGVRVSYEIERLRTRSAVGEFDSSPDVPDRVGGVDLLRTFRRASARRLRGRFHGDTGVFRTFYGDPPFPIDEVPLDAIQGAAVLHSIHDDGVRAALDTLHGLFLPAAADGVVRRPYVLWLPGGTGYRIEVEVTGQGEEVTVSGAGDTEKVFSDRVLGELLPVTSFEVKARGVVRAGRLVEARADYRLVARDGPSSFGLRFSAEDRP